MDFEKCQLMLFIGRYRWRHIIYYNSIMYFSPISIIQDVFGKKFHIVIIYVDQFCVKIFWYLRNTLIYAIFLSVYSKISLNFQAFCKVRIL